MRPGFLARPRESQKLSETIGSLVNGNLLLRTCACLVLGLASTLSGCESFPEPPPSPFKPAPPAMPYAKSDALAQFEASSDEGYRIGEGDSVTLHVWDRPELTVTQTVGPDGVLTVPVVGPMRVTGLSREEAAKAVRHALDKFFDGLTVTVRVDQYTSNRVVVLGKVRIPGVQKFDGPPTLLEALSRAGGLSDDTRTFTHCAVVRGRDRVVWLDLRTLLEAGDLSLNLRLKPNDLVLIPEWVEAPVYLLGQVAKPGPYKWTRGMTVLDALALAGGLTRDAATFRIVLVRPGLEEKIILEQTDLVSGVPGANVAVQPGDILYVPSNILAEVGYILEKINPFGWVFLAQTVR